MVKLKIVSTISLILGFILLFIFVAQFVAIAIAKNASRSDIGLAINFVIGIGLCIAGYGIRKANKIAAGATLALLLVLIVFYVSNFLKGVTYSSPVEAFGSLVLWFLSPLVAAIILIADWKELS